MATLCLGSLLIYQNFRLRRPKRFICRSTTKRTPDNASDDVIRRRSGKLSPWDHRYLLSIKNKYAVKKDEKVITRDLLKNKVRKMLDAANRSSLEQLELIDDLHKLGISYHFELEINNVLTDLYQKNVRKVCECNKEDEIHATALKFRILRQHGFNVSEDIFDVIIDETDGGMFKSKDIQGFISLYEASYLSTKLDSKLHKVIRPFAIEQIRKIVDCDHDNDTFPLSAMMHVNEQVCILCKDEVARGDVLKSVQCYMHETGASEEEARAHVEQMISDTWKEMNTETKTARISTLLSRCFVEAAMNLARMSQCTYQHGDGHGCPDKAKTVDCVMSLLVNPIPLDELK